MVQLIVVIPETGEIPQGHEESYIILLTAASLYIAVIMEMEPQELNHLYAFLTGHQWKRGKNVVINSISLSFTVSSDALEKKIKRWLYLEIGTVYQFSNKHHRN